MTTTSTEKRAQIGLLKVEGYSQRLIAARLSIAPSTVNDIIQLIKSTGSLAAGNSSERPRITTVQTDHANCRLTTKNPIAPRNQIAAELPRNAIVSTRTVRRESNKEKLSLP